MQEYGRVVAYLVFRVQDWALLGLKASARCVGWNMMMRKEGCAGQALVGGMSYLGFRLLLGLSWGRVFCQRCGPGNRG